MKKTFSKAFTVILAVALLASQILVPSYAQQATGYCSVCGEHGIVGELQHAINPTCGDIGFNIFACEYVKDGTNCAGTITVKVAATGIHTGNGNVVAKVEPTCTEAGSEAYEKCIDCDCYLIPGTATEMDTIVIAANGHNYVPTVTDPTCTADGYTTYVCSVCEHTYTDDETDATGHDFSVHMEGLAATCRTEGYSDYYVCSDCGIEDPARPKQTLPVEDHNGKIVDHQDATCTVDGYNIFKCEKTDCPYYAGVKEVLPATRHKIVNHVAKQATCTEGGYDAYETCEKCDYTTYNAASEVAPLGHTTVNKGYVAPTCTQSGLTDAVVCDRCDFVHHSGEEIAPTGHTLITVAANDATCTENGNIAHKKCTVCSKLFATTATGAPTDAAITNIVVTKLGHEYSKWTQQPTCTEVGYDIYTCTRTVGNSECKHTYSEEIAATGHTFKYVAQVDAECGVDGVKAHNECTVCEKLFAADASASDINATAVALTDLKITALEHAAEVVAKVNPTYNAAGNEAGSKCSLCGEPLNGAANIAELDEAVKFNYVISGVNGSGTAVNSGYVTLEVYFEVLADIDDMEEYNSDVLANIFAVDFAMNFDAAAFELTCVEVAPGAFTKAAFTPLDIANSNGNIAITQDMVNTSKAFRDNNLFATLTFQVATDAPAADYTFDLSNLLVVHPESENIDTTASEMMAEISVAKLGDANGDTIFTSADTLAVSNYIKNPDVEKEYVAEYDMDKDGDIDFIDLDLLRKAIVGNEEYLGIIVDPNETATPEV